MIAYRVRYEGAVQGVYFRATAKEFAEGHDLAGYVRNLPDGSVELFVQGDRSDVVAFLNDVEERYLSNIRHQTRSHAPFEPDLRTFEIRG